LNLLLQRLTEFQNSTMGVLFLEGQPRFVTLEDPWKNNAEDESCIPSGVYQAVRHISPKYGECFWVRNVPGRTEILIHWGNAAKDTRGCILLGMSFGSSPNVAWISDSRRACDHFMLAMKNTHKATLTVENFH